MQVFFKYYRWIVCGVITLESVISWKFRHDTGNLLYNEIPLYISMPWVLAIAAFICYYLYLRFHPHKITKYGDSAWEIEQRKMKEILENKEEPQKIKEKKGENEEIKQRKEQTQKVSNKKNKSQVEENQEDKNKKNNREVEPSSPDVTEQRKNWNKKKIGESIETSKLSPSTIVETFVPEESEWRTIKPTNPGKKSDKKKKD